MNIEGSNLGDEECAFRSQVNTLSREKHLVKMIYNKFSLGQSCSMPKPSHGSRNGIREQKKMSVKMEKGVFFTFAFTRQRRLFAFSFI